MLSQLLLGALLSFSVLAVEEQKRQAGPGSEFSAAASQLISNYIPQSALNVLQPGVAAAASSASVSYSNVEILIYSAFLASSIPAWFNSAIPSAYSTQLFQLEADISSLRSGIYATAAATTPVVVVVPVTTTNSAGSTFTTSVASTSFPATTTSTVTTGTVTTSTATTGPPVTTTYTNSAGSTITSVLGGAAGTAASGASSAGSVAVSGASSVGSVAVSGASSVGSVAVSGASSAGSRGVSGASSVVSAASSVFAPSTTGAAARPTAFPGAAAGALGLIGLMAAL